MGGQGARIEDLVSWSPSPYHLSTPRWPRAAWRQDGTHITLRPDLWKSSGPTLQFIDEEPEAGTCQNSPSKAREEPSVTGHWQRIKP